MHVIAPWSVLIATASAAAWVCETHSFVFSKRGFTIRSRRKLSSPLQHYETQEADDKTFPLSDYDFSSPTGWEAFYQHRTLNQNHPRKAASASSSSFVWHDSIPLERIITKYIIDNQSAATTTNSTTTTCLIVGCGNDVQLPTIMLQLLPTTTPQQQQEQHAAAAVATTTTIIDYVDSSSTCLEQLRCHFGDQLNYHCEDAITFLANRHRNNNNDNNNKKCYDVILDKGLCDAIMCGEGWDKPLADLFHAAANCLSTNGGGGGGGMYLLISYRLSTSTKQFLTSVGNEVGLQWSFDLPESNQRVSVSVAHRKQL